MLFSGLLFSYIVKPQYIPYRQGVQRRYLLLRWALLQSLISSQHDNFRSVPQFWDAKRASGWIHILCIDDVLPFVLLSDQ